VDGQLIRGEDSIGEPETPDRPEIRRVYLDPQPHVTVRARKAIERSERIILGPGDVYTSIVPNLLVRGVPEAIADADAEVIYIVNLMTKPGETDGYRASDFVEAIGSYLGRLPDTVVVHTTGHDPDRIARYAGAQAVAVEADLDRLTTLVPRVVTGNFATEEQFIRHDAEKVVAALWPVEV
jgi:uncharacterized cofD-like protein